MTDDNKNEHEERDCKPRPARVPDSLGPIPWSLQAPQSSGDELLIKEQVRVFDTAKYYDIHDKSNKKVAQCSEKLTILQRILRNTLLEKCLPFYIKIESKDNKDVFYIKRDFSFATSRISILDKNKKSLATFKENLKLTGQSVSVFDEHSKLLFEIHGDIMGWNYYFIKGTTTLATVNQESSGALKEVFTNADNYRLVFYGNVINQKNLVRKIILAVTIALDVVIKDGYKYFRNTPLRASSYINGIGERFR